MFVGEGVGVGVVFFNGKGLRLIVVMQEKVIFGFFKLDKKVKINWLSSYFLDGDLVVEE